jgi:hypothetical protein
MDVAMQAEQRSDTLHSLENAGRTDRAAHQVACRCLEPEVLVEDGRSVQARAIRRAVNKEDRSPGIGGLVGERVDLFAKRILGDLARRLPRRGAGLSQPHDLQVSWNVDDGAIRVHAVLAGSERLVDVVGIVVAGDEDERYSGAIQPLGR